MYAYFNFLFHDNSYSQKNTVTELIYLSIVMLRNSFFFLASISYKYINNRCFALVGTHDTTLSFAFQALPVCQFARFAHH